MGKVAETERLKLRATFFNNLSVGFYVSGLLIPYIAIIQHSGDIASTLVRGTFSHRDLLASIGALAAMGFAVCCANLMRRYANETIAKIEDEPQHGPESGS
jgi:hypothetical protein